MSWPLVPLLSCCSVTTGKHDANHGKIDGTYPFYTCADKPISAHTFSFDGDSIILPGNGANVGLVLFYSGKFEAYQRTYVLNKFVDGVDSRYVYHHLNRYWKLRNERSQFGSATNYIRMQNFEDYEIPLPPLAEQKRIAAILDKADAIRRKRQQAIQLADEFLRSVFLDMFGDPVTNPKGWREVILKDIADIRSGVTKGKKIDLEKSVSLPYMRVANVQDGYLDLSEIKQIVVSKKDAEKCKLKKGDVLLTEGGDPDKLGRGYIWNNEVEHCIHQNHIFSVRIKDEKLVTSEFLSALISSQRGKRYFLKVGKQTTGIATINKTVLSDFMAFVPPIEIQKEYIAIKNKVNKQKLSYRLGDLSLFEALSQQAFLGSS